MKSQEILSSLFAMEEELRESVHKTETDLTPCKQVFNQEFFLLLLTN